MIRIRQLLKVLEDKLDGDGSLGQVSEDSMKGIVAIMKDMNHLETRCTYLNILIETQDDRALTSFVSAGGWNILNEWLMEVHQQNQAFYDSIFLEELLRALVKLPVTVESLKKHSTPKIIKSLSEDPSVHKNVQKLAGDIVNNWMKVVKKDSAKKEEKKEETKPSNDKEKNSKSSSVSAANQNIEVKIEKESKEKSKHVHAPLSSGPRKTGLENSDSVPRPKKRLSSELGTKEAVPEKKLKESKVIESSAALKAPTAKDSGALKFDPEKKLKESKPIEPSTTSKTPVTKDSGSSKSETEKLDKKPSNPLEPKSPSKITNNSKPVSVSSPKSDKPKKEETPAANHVNEKKPKVVQQASNLFADAIFKPAAAPAPVKKKKTKNVKVVKLNNLPVVGEKKEPSKETSEKIKEEKVEKMKDEKLKIEAASNDQVEMKKEDSIETKAVATEETAIKKEEISEESENSKEKQTLLEYSGEGPRPILVYHREKKKGLKVKWPESDDNLVQIEYIEIEEGERTNHAKRSSFGEIAKMEMMKERLEMQRAKCDNIVAWKLVEIEPSAVRRVITKEVEFQNKREIESLAEIYFNRSAIPPSPKEPYPENLPQVDPIIIPWEDPPQYTTPNPNPDPQAEELISVKDLPAEKPAATAAQSVEKSKPSIISVPSNQSLNTSAANNNPTSKSSTQETSVSSNQAAGIISNSNIGFPSISTAAPQFSQPPQNWNSTSNPFFPGVPPNGPQGYPGQQTSSHSPSSYPQSFNDRDQRFEPPVVSFGSPSTTDEPIELKNFLSSLSGANPNPAQARTPAPPAVVIRTKTPQNPGFEPSLLVPPPNPPNRFIRPDNFPGFSNPQRPFSRPPVRPNNQDYWNEPRQFRPKNHHHHHQNHRPRYNNRDNFRSRFDPEPSRNSPPPGLDASKVCIYHAQGNCRNGDKCKFFHVPRGPPKEPSPPPTGRDVDERAYHSRTR